MPCGWAGEPPITVWWRVPGCRSPIVWQPRGGWRSTRCSLAGERRFSRPGPCPFRCLPGESGSPSAGRYCSPSAAYGARDGASADVVARRGVRRVRIVAVGYLSPSGTAPAATARSRQPQPTAARLRARGLAEQWRAADLAVRLAVYRRRLEPELARRRATDQPGPALLVEAPDTLPVHTPALVASALDTVWRELGLGVSKVAVGVVVDFRRFPRTGTDSTP